jgi:hypothetical protein
MEFHSADIEIFMFGWNTLHKGVDVSGLHSVAEIFPDQVDSNG